MPLEASESNEGQRRLGEWVGTFPGYHSERDSFGLGYGIRVSITQGELEQVCRLRRSLRSAIPPTHWQKAELETGHAGRR